MIIRKLSYDNSYAKLILQYIMCLYRLLTWHIKMHNITLNDIMMKLAHSNPFIFSNWDLFVVYDIVSCRTITVIFIKSELISSQAWNHNQRIRLRPTRMHSGQKDAFHAQRDYFLKELYCIWSIMSISIRWDIVIIWQTTRINFRVAYYLVLIWLKISSFTRYIF